MIVLCNNKVSHTFSISFLQAAAKQKDQLEPSKQLLNVIYQRRLPQGQAKFKSGVVVRINREKAGGIKTNNILHPKRIIELEATTQ